MVESDWRPLIGIDWRVRASAELDTHQTLITAIQMATIIEFIHTSTCYTLIDVCDEFRPCARGKKPIMKQWGNAPSVLVGRLPVSRAFNACRCGSMRCMSI